MGCGVIAQVEARHRGPFFLLVTNLVTLIRVILQNGLSNEGTRLETQPITRRGAALNARASLGSRSG